MKSFYLMILRQILDKFGGVQEKVKNVSNTSPLLISNGDLAVINVDTANTL